MLRYVALAFLLSSTSSEFTSSAAGNIGCLFSETLCNQEKEWCNDDLAFGRCLPLYGSVREGDMHRYELGTAELHVLELEMQRLYLLGYRWSHTYTQCVLQALLRAIRNKSDLDVDNCNEELDQDLEGALNAIEEGEEMEHVDPRNLAIVRFKPSNLNPQSGYADELYFPPGDELLPQFRINTKNEDEKTLEKEESEHKQMDSQDLIQSPFPTVLEKGKLKGSREDVNVPKDVDERYSNSIKDHLSLPTNVIPMPTYQGDQPYQIDAGDYDYDLGFDNPYGLLPRTLYKRTGYNSAPPINFGEMESYRKKPMKPGDLKTLANMLINLRTKEDRLENQPIYYGNTKMDGIDYLQNRKYDSDENIGFFRETPIIPYIKARDYPPFSNDKNSVYAPYENDYKLRGSYYKSDLPELDLPKEEDPIPDTIHAGYVKEFEDENLQNDNARKLGQSKNINKIEKFNNPNNYKKIDASSSDNDNSVSHFENNLDSKFNFETYRKPMNDPNSYKWDKNSNNDVTNHGNLYQKHKNPQSSYGDPMNPVSGGFPLPKDSYYGGMTYPAYYDYPSYYDDYAGGYIGHEASSPWNFQREERLDVKKPGPWTKSNNNYGFDYYAGDQDYPDYREDNGVISRLDPKEGDALIMDRMRQEFGGKNKAGKHQNLQDFPDLMLTEEGYVQAVSDKARSNIMQGRPTASHRVSNKVTQHDIDKEENQKDSYVYISINGNFTSTHQANQLVAIILSKVGLNMTSIQHLRVKNNQVSFQLRENNLSMTTALLAQRTKELRDVIKEATDIEIIQAGVGNKVALSAVVYSSSDRQLFNAAAIVCGVVAALLVAASVVYFLRQNAKSKAKLQGLTTHSDASKDYEDLCRSRISGKGESKESSGPGHAHVVGTNGSSTNASGQRISSLSKDPENGNKSPSSRSSTSSWTEEPVMSNMDISTGHMVLSYMEDHLRNKDRLEQEWVALCAYEAEPCACHLALKPENAQKNRYPDIVPYDHNRVHLNEHTNVTGSNYVNASCITDHDPRNPAYISTQGPLASTAADFWQLIWEQGSVVIVMLTRLTENGQSLCHRYWPEEGSELYHIYEVHLVSEHIWCDDYLVRSFYLKNARTGETRTVTQFHFLSWPQSGIPASTKALLEFRRKVNKSYRGRSCPIIVHCSDGVGRAGTFCLIDMVLNRMAKGAKEIDIAATLEHIRDQKPNMVKTKTQFEFVLMAVAEEVHAILKALPQ